MKKAAGIGQFRFNGDFRRGKLPVTGRRSKKEDEKKPTVGFFHILPEQLQNSLLAMSKKMAKQNHSLFKQSIQKHREKRKEKDCIQLQKSLEKRKKMS